MVSLGSKLQDFIINIKNSLNEILFGFILFLLAISGFFVALLLRSLNFNGGLIITYSIITEIFSIILCYLIFNYKYLKETSQEKRNQKIKKQ